VHWVDYYAPSTVNEAVQLLKERRTDARALAGGTDLLVQLNAGARKARVLIDVKKIPALNEIRWNALKGLTLGAAVPCYRIYANRDVIEHYPGLIDVVSMIGGTPIQGRASVGGNLCNAAPSGDSIPMLIALGVNCKVAGTKGVRYVPAEEFCIAPGQNSLEADEFLVSLAFPPPEPHSGARYLRFIPRNEMDIAVAGAGVAVTLDDGKFSAARVALASVAPTPLLVPEAAERLVGQKVGPEAIAQAAAAAKEAAKPISDMRGTAEYRKHLCEVLTRRALEDAVRRAQGEEVQSHAA
jgi:carbon-monoxide dehydrogenase medium subunit